MSNNRTVSWSEVVPFHIDSGELSGIPPEMAFVLGVEFALITSMLRRNHVAFVETIHPQNAQRIRSTAEHLSRRVRMSKLGGDFWWSVSAEEDVAGLLSAPADPTQ